MPTLPINRAELNRTALIALGVFWLAFVSLYTFRAMLVAPDEVLGKMGPRLSVTLVGALLSWIMYRVIELLPARTFWARSLGAVGVAFPTAMLFAIGDAFGGGVIKPDFSRWCPHSPTCTWFDVWSLEIDNTIVWTFVFTAWGMLHLTLRATAEARAADERAFAESEAARIAEIRALRYQINPHFLYNCLNSLSALVRRENIRQAEDMIGDLGQFIRFSLTVDPVADVSLDSEVEMQLRYLQLEQRRFGDRMRLDVAIDPAVASSAVPPLILQPLVENAVKHGIDTTRDTVTIAITARLAEPGIVAVTVETSKSDASRPREGLGIGQANVAARLSARFGAAASFMAGPVGDGYRAELRFPLEDTMG